MYKGSWDMNTSWKNYGSCRGLNPNIFYPSCEEEARVAKAICRQCPVQNECLSYALKNQEKDGVWGGATERDRRRMIRQRLKTA